jgi:hypothetical protein
VQLGAELSQRQNLLDQRELWPVSTALFVGLDVHDQQVRQPNRELTRPAEASRWIALPWRTSGEYLETFHSVLLGKDGRHGF